LTICVASERHVSDGTDEIEQIGDDPN
jgi:hypothetical protein